MLSRGLRLLARSRGVQRVGSGSRGAALASLGLSSFDLALASAPAPAASGLCVVHPAVRQSLRSLSSMGGVSNDLLVSLSMNFNNSGANHRELCENLKKNTLLKSPLIEYAFRKTDRAHFDPSAWPYEDKPHDIGCGATITSAHMHAIAVEAISEALIPKGGTAGAAAHAANTRPRSFLDVASGSGYVTAILGAIAQSNDAAVRFASQQQQLGAATPSSPGAVPAAAGPAKSYVVGVDIVPALTAQALSNVRAANPALVAGADSTVSFLTVDPLTVAGAKSIPHGPFDAVHVGVALASPPTALLARLRVGGQLIAPVFRQGSNEQDLVVYTRKRAAPAAAGAAAEAADSELTPPAADAGSAAVEGFINTHFTAREVMRCVYSPSFSQAELDAAVKAGGKPVSKPALNPRLSAASAALASSQSGGTGAGGASSVDRYFKPAAAGGGSGALSEADLAAERAKAAQEAQQAKDAQKADLTTQFADVTAELDKASAFVKAWHASFTAKNERKPTLNDMNNDEDMAAKLAEVRELNKRKAKIESGLRGLEMKQPK